VKGLGAKNRNQTVNIIFKALQGGEWREMERLAVDPSDPFHTEQVAIRYVRDHGISFYDKKLGNIALRQCFRAAIEDGTNTVFIALGRELAITRAMVVSGSKPLGMDTRPGKNRKCCR
jgi:hypothetical protein